MDRNYTYFGVSGLKATGYDWFHVSDPLRVEEYATYLQGEPGVKIKVVGDRLDVSLHLSHLPLLPGFSGYRSMIQLDGPYAKLLHGYQREAVNAILGRRGTILADDLGLGKTRTTIAAAGWPMLIFCPKTAISVWEDELELFGLSYLVLSGRTPDMDVLKDERPDAWVVPYHVAPYWVSYFNSLGVGPEIDTLIADEAHYMQKKMVAWTTVFKSIKREKTILLTATPIRNRLVSLWSLLDAACPGAWGSQYEFRRLYCMAEETAYGLVDREPSPELLDRLQKRLQMVVIKRTREDVVQVLPSLDRKLIELQIDADQVFLDAYKKAVLSTFHREGSVSTHHLAHMTEMRRKMGMLKATASITKIVALLKVWKRCVIWVWHNDVVDYLKKELPELTGLPKNAIDVITGGTTTKVRDEVARRWKNENPETPGVLIASIAAASTAISLTSCGLAVFIEQDWAPLQMIQAEKRTHRFGQKNKNCLAIYFTVANSIDESINKVLLEKAQEAESVLGKDGQVNQMRSILGLAEEESDSDFMSRVANQF